MDTKKLQSCVDWAQGELGGGLVASDIWPTGSTAVAGYNQIPPAVTYFDALTQHLRQSSEKTGILPPLGRYYTVEYGGDKLVVVLMHKNLMWGLLVDATKTKPETVVGSIIPKALSKLEEAAG
jgi:hypothetical protein